MAIRQFKLDVQSNPYAFACFITAFTDVEGFDSMPWGERENAYFAYSGMFVGERTLRNWCSKLIEQNAIAKVGGSTYWKTEFMNGIKVRTQVQREDTIAYYNRRTEIIQQETGKNILAGMTRKDAYKEAWGVAYSLLWDELKCCYYCCKGFLLTAFSNDETMIELMELTRQISGKEERLSL